MPTEAEWEYAARGGKKSKGYKYSGSNNYDDVAWTKENSGGKAHMVRSKKPNELGLYDMSGNVAEWCQDWHGDYTSDSVKNPTGPVDGKNKVFRGGDWNGREWSHFVSWRQATTLPERCFDDIGFRLALSE